MRTAAFVTLVRKICLVAAVAGLALPALAADPKPDARSRTRTSRPVSSSTTRSRPIRRWRRIASPRAGMARQERRRGASSRKQDPAILHDGGWTFERKYSVRSVVADRYVSIVRADYMDTGGAHPNTDVNTVLWDTTAKKRISIRPFFTETADNGPTMTAMLKAVIASLKAEKKKRDASETATAEWFKEPGADAAQDRRGDAGAVDRSRQELRPDLPLSALCGRPLCRRPIRRLRAVGDAEALSDAGRRRIFGGARPKGDDDEQP